MGLLSLLRKVFAPAGSPGAGEIGRPQTPPAGPDRPLDDFVEGGRAIFWPGHWVEYARYNLALEELELGFRGGWVGFYGPCPPDLAATLARASSGGKWAHRNLKAGYNPDRTWQHTMNYRHG